MDGAVDIAALAIPFASGVAAAAAVSALCPGSIVYSGLLQLVSLYSSVVLATWCCLDSRCHTACYSLCFFTLGLFCHFSYSLFESEVWRPDAVLTACEKLKSLIRSIHFPGEDTPGLILALMTGDKSELGRGTVESFRRSGASHILALSGLHLGLIYSIIRKCLSILGNSPAARRIRCGSTLACAAFYTLMTGAGASLVRAFIFICINELASLSPGRVKKPERVYLASLTIQLALRPTVISSVGFQLSYMAMAGIVFVFPKIKEWYPAEGGAYGRFDPMSKIWEAAALSISCQLFTAPLSWIHFHSFPKYFLLTNLLALPLSSAIMSLSAFTLVLSAAGICPHALVVADDFCVRMLTFVLETISSM